MRGDPIEFARRQAAGEDLDAADFEAMHDWTLGEHLAFRREIAKHEKPRAPPPWGEELLFQGSVLVVAWLASHGVRGWRRDPWRLAYVSPVVPVALLIAEARERSEWREARRRGMTRAGDGPLRVPLLWPAFAATAGNGLVLWWLRRRGRYPRESDLVYGVATALAQATLRRVEWRLRGGPPRLPRR